MNTQLFGRLKNGENVSLSASDGIVTLKSQLSAGRFHEGTILVGIVPHGGAIYIGTSKKTAGTLTPPTSTSAMQALPQNTAMSFSCEERDLDTLYIATDGTNILIYVWEFGPA